MSNDMDCNDQFTGGNNIYETKCPRIYALEIIGQKWKLPIMWYLFENNFTRYNELKRKVKGITNMILTKSLDELSIWGEEQLKFDKARSNF